jgi:hypothetical protein
MIFANPPGMMANDPQQTKKTKTKTKTTFSFHSSAWQKPRFTENNNREGESPSAMNALEKAEQPMKPARLTTVRQPKRPSSGVFCAFS